MGSRPALSVPLATFAEDLTRFGATVGAGAAAGAFFASLAGVLAMLWVDRAVPLERWVLRWMRTGPARKSAHTCGGHARFLAESRREFDTYEDDRVSSQAGVLSPLPEMTACAILRSLKHWGSTAARAG